MQYLLYDHECPFCCSIIKKVSSLIDEPNISYNHLQSKEARKLIARYSLENVNSVIFINHKKKVFIKADAILNLCKSMNFPYNLFYILTILPKSLLNLAYDFIAKNRMNIKI